MNYTVFQITACVSSSYDHGAMHMYWASNYMPPHHHTKPHASIIDDLALPIYNFVQNEISSPNMALILLSSVY